MISRSSPAPSLQSAKMFEFSPFASLKFATYQIKQVTTGPDAVSESSIVAIQAKPDLDTNNRVLVAISDSGASFPAAFSISGSVSRGMPVFMATPLMCIGGDIKSYILHLLAAICIVLRSTGKNYRSLSGII